MKKYHCINVNHTSPALNHSNIPKDNHIGTLLKLYGKYLVIHLLISKRHIISKSCNFQTLLLVYHYMSNYQWTCLHIIQCWMRCIKTKLNIDSFTQMCKKFRIRVKFIFLIALRREGYPWVVDLVLQNQ